MKLSKTLSDIFIEQVNVFESLEFSDSPYEYKDNAFNKESISIKSSSLESIFRFFSKISLVLRICGSPRNNYNSDIYVELYDLVDNMKIHIDDKSAKIRFTVTFPDFYFSEYSDA